MTALILATLALALSTFAVIQARKYRNDLDGYIDALIHQIVAVENDLHTSKERINEDLVEHNKRLNRHREKLIRDYNRLLIIDQKQKDQPS